MTQKNNSFINSLLWITGSSLVAKSSAILTHFAIGFYLISEELAIQALASAIFVLFSPLSEQGVQKLLIVYARFSVHLRVLIIKIGFVLQLLFAVIVFSISLYLIYIGKREEAELIWYHIPALFLLLYSGVLRSKMQIIGDFRSLSKAITYSSVFKSTIIIIGLILGFSYYSIVIGLLASKTLEIILLNQFSKSRQQSISNVADSSKELNAEGLFQAFGWLLVGGLTGAAVTNGDYFMIGLSSSAKDLGQYYFGYQSITVISSVIITSVSLVLLPKFSQETAVKRQGFLLRGILVTLYFLSPSLLLLSIIIPTMFDAIWGDKWFYASVVAAIMCCALSTRIYGPIFRSFLEAQGEWKKQALIQFLDGFGLMMVSAWCALYFMNSDNFVAGIGLGIGLYRVLVGVALLLYSLRFIYRSVPRALILNGIFGALFCSTVLVYLILTDGSIYLAASIVMVYYFVSCCFLREARSFYLDVIRDVKGLVK